MNVLVGERVLPLQEVLRTISITPRSLRENNLSGTLPILEPAPQLSYTLLGSDMPTNNGFKSIVHKLSICVAGKNTDTVLAHTVQARLYRNGVLTGGNPGGSVPADNFWGLTWNLDAAQGDLLELAIWADLVLVVSFDRSFIQVGWSRPTLFQAERVLREIAASFVSIPNASPAGWVVGSSASWKFHFLDVDAGTTLPSWSARAWAAGPVSGMGRLGAGDPGPDSAFLTHAALRPYRDQSHLSQLVHRATSLKV